MYISLFKNQSQFSYNQLMTFIKGLLDLQVYKRTYYVLFFLQKYTDYIEKHVSLTRLFQELQKL